MSIRPECPFQTLSSPARGNSSRKPATATRSLLPISNPKGIRWQQRRTERVQCLENHLRVILLLQVDDDQMQVFLDGEVEGVQPGLQLITRAVAHPFTEGIREEQVRIGD